MNAKALDLTMLDSWLWDAACSIRGATIWAAVCYGSTDLGLRDGEPDL